MLNYLSFIANTHSIMMITNAIYNVTAPKMNPLIYSRKAKISKFPKPSSPESNRKDMELYMPKTADRPVIA